MTEQEVRIQEFKRRLANYECWIRYRDKSQKTGTVSFKLGFPYDATSETINRTVRELTPYADKHVLTPAGLRHGRNHRFHFYANSTEKKESQEVIEARIEVHEEKGRQLRLDD